MEMESAGGDIHLFFYPGFPSLSITSPTIVKYFAFFSPIFVLCSNPNHSSHHPPLPHSCFSVQKLSPYLAPMNTYHMI